MMWVRANAVNCGLAAAFLFRPQQALAHVSEMGFVLLLPTELYITAGIWTVFLTVLALAFLPPALSERLFAAKKLIPLGRAPSPILTSWLSFSLFMVALTIGIAGSRDPLANPLPLLIWTVWWIVLVVVQGLAGDVWRYVNPWTAPYAWTARYVTPWVRLPKSLGCWPACLMLLLFASFAFADPAPDDPDRLALIAGLYWLFIFAGMLVAGSRFLERFEFFTRIMALIARLSPLAWRRRHVWVGLNGWRLLRPRQVSVSTGVMALLILGVGSFDGFNETFFWLAQIGVNPLLFPGRSAIVAETIGGLLLTNLLLLLIFAACVWMGLRLADKRGFLEHFGAWALATLPIGLAYHIAHYLVSAMINLQYVLAALTDPLTNGSDLLGLGTFYVTTGFLNRPQSVEVIFQIQAASVVIGHVLAILIAHVIAVRAFAGDRKRAFLSQLPVALFMIGYTFLGLWLLAAPKGA